MEEFSTRVLLNLTEQLGIWACAVTLLDRTDAEEGLRGALCDQLVLLTILVLAIW